MNKFESLEMPDADADKTPLLKEGTKLKILQRTYFDCCHNLTWGILLNKSIIEYIFLNTIKSYLILTAMLNING